MICVVFKDEDEVDGQPVGPVVIVADIDGAPVTFVPAELRWHSRSAARKLADDLGATFEAS